MRLFIAIQLPDFVGEHLRRFQTALRPAISARWIPDSQMHLTLKFTGETPELKLRNRPRQFPPENPSKSTPST
jgi:2'-5' RNA ligase